MQFHRSLLLLFSLIIVCSLTAQITPAEAVAGMGRGINLGNTLEPPRETEWNNGPAQEAYFDAYVEAGFTNIRIPVRWDKHTGNAAPYTIDGSWMDRVEQVVGWALERDLYVTLNGHHEDWLKTDYSQTNQDRYDAIWRQIVERFKDKSDKLLYEIINEPNGLTVAQVDDLNERILGIIRAEEPTRLVIFGGNMYANAEQLFQAAIPGNNDQYLVGYYHSYDPWPFAGEHQGTWGSDAQYRAVTNKFQSAANWSSSQNIPVHLSEYNARVEADYNSRMRWIAHNVEMSVKFGFAFSIWDDGGWFKVLDRTSNTWPESKDIYIHYYPDSPHQIFSSKINDAEGNSLILLEWKNRAIGNDSIIVEKSSENGATWTPVTTLSPTATDFLDPAVTNGETYYYRLWTKRADGTLLHGYPTKISIRTDGGFQSSFNDTPIAIPGTLEVEDYDLGGQDVAYNDSDPANQGGSYRPGESVDIGGVPGGGFSLGYVTSGEWLEFTVEVAEAGTYEVRAQVASAASTASQFEISFPDDVTTTFATPLTNDWNTYRSVNANDELFLSAGRQIMRLEITGSQAFNVDRLIFTLKSTSTEAEATIAGFTVAPNPVSAELNVTLPTGFDRTNGKLRLFNTAGARVAEYKASADTTVLNVQALPAGPYFLHLADGERSLVRRIIVR